MGAAAASGLLLLLQQREGLRPSEAPGITPDNTRWGPLFVNDQSKSRRYFDVTVSNLREKTEAGRPQTVVVKSGGELNLLRQRLVLSGQTPRGAPLEGITCANYRKLCLTTNDLYGLSQDILCQSPRADFAIDRISDWWRAARGMREGGRNNEKTFKDCIDFIASLRVSLGKEGLRLGGNA